jgi:hypothetical protein
MSADNFSKTNRTQEEKDIFATPEFPSEAKSATEQKEAVFEDKERERIRQEVLKEIQEAEKTTRKGPVPSPVITPVQPLAKNPALVKIESILEEDLQDAYFKMEPKLQQKFKTEGEKTAAKIEQMLVEVKVKANKIFKLIFKWLKIIPGVNKFFIKQEAKIKTDKILKLK